MRWEFFSNRHWFEQFGIIQSICSRFDTLVLFYYDKLEFESWNYIERGSNVLFTKSYVYTLAQLMSAINVRKNFRCRNCLAPNPVVQTKTRNDLQPLSLNWDIDSDWLFLEISWQNYFIKIQENSVLDDVQFERLNLVNVGLIWV